MKLPILIDVETGKAAAIVRREIPDIPVVIGASYKFDYPSEFISLPLYTAHAGQMVVVIRALTEDEAEPPDYENGITQMYLVRAADGWEGHAWDEELLR